METHTEAAPRPSRRLLAAVLSFMLLVAAGGYAWYGRPDAWRGAPEAAAAASPEAQIAAMVGQLEERLKSQPDDAQGWAMLGRSYSVLGRYAEADQAFQKVVALRPADAQAWADRADALAMANGRQLRGEPEQLIARALELDPRNLKALALAGTLAFDRADYATAARLWESAVAAGEPGSELVRNLQGGVDEARKRAALAAAGPAASAPAPAVAQAGPPGAPRPSAPSASARLSGRVVLAPDLQGRAAPEDTVFVFARAVDGPRAPLAVLRRQVKDLPFDFVLDDTHAMNAALRLSSAREVVVSARVSKAGNAVAQPGDLQGNSPPVAVGADGLQIVITQVVK
jgi:cytochrome c-type biogenesis protein CcmH